MIVKRRKKIDVCACVCVNYYSKMCSDIKIPPKMFILVRVCLKHFNELPSDYFFFSATLTSSNFNTRNVSAYNLSHRRSSLANSITSFTSQSLK